MKDKLLKLLKTKEARMAELEKRNKESDDAAELRSVGAEIGTLTTEIAELRSMIAEIEAEEKTSENNAGEQRQQPVGATQVLGTYGVQGQEQRAEKGTDSAEYRSAFMNYVLKGQKSENLEMRATSTTGDIGAVIPSTVMQKIIEKMVEYGRIFSRVSKTNIKGGVEIPVTGAKPTATWVAEGSVADLLIELK